MKLLLDTHVSLAAGGATNRLPQRVADLLLDESNALFVSAISAWEIASKHRLGKLPLAAPPEEWLRNVIGDLRALILPFTMAHALAIHDLPLIHCDPFDRMLICQARVEGMTIITSDDLVRQYDVPTLW